MNATGTERRERLEAVRIDLNDVDTRLERLYDALGTTMKVTLDDLGPRIRRFTHRQDQLMAAKEELEQTASERTLHWYHVATTTYRDSWARGHSLNRGLSSGHSCGRFG